MARWGPDNFTSANGGFRPVPPFTSSFGTGRIIPNALYRASSDNVGFRATTITTPVSVLRRKQQVRLRLHVGHRPTTKRSLKADRGCYVRGLLT